MYDHYVEKSRDAANMMNETVEEINLAVSRIASASRAQQLALREEEKKASQPSSPKMTDTSSSVQLLTNLVNVSKSKFLARKPRSLLFSRQVDDFMLTTTLDGSIQSWSLERKGLVGTSHLPSMLNQTVFAEDVCLNHKGTHLAVALAEPSSSSGTDLTLESSSSASMISHRLLYIPLSQKTKEIYLQPSFPVHTKGISVVESFYDGPSDRSLFLTGGFDKTVAFWDTNDTGTELKVKEVHRRHTSVVHTIAQQVQSRIIWTGGADKYIHMYLVPSIFISIV